MEAQRYPADYDGLVAGAPAQNATRSYLAGHLWPALATDADPESYVPAAKIPLLAKPSMRRATRSTASPTACSTIRALPLRSGVHVCKDGQDQATCLTGKQVAAVKKIYAGAH